MLGDSQNQKQFLLEGEIAEKVHTQDKLCKKSKSTKLHIEEEIYIEAQKSV